MSSPSTGFPPQSNSTTPLVATPIATNSSGTATINGQDPNKIYKANGTLNTIGGASGGTNQNGSWNPGQPATQLIAPDAAAYNAQNSQQLLNQAQQNATLGQVPGNAQVGNVNLGGTSTYNAATAPDANKYGASTYNANTFNGAGIAPLMMLNGAQVGTNVQNQNATASEQAINNLNNIASGNGPNAATIAAQQTGQQNAAAQMAAIASAGGNPALAQRNAAQQAAQNAQTTQQAAVLGSAQEQLGAQGTLQSALNNQTVSGQAIPLAQAQLSQQAALANQGIQSQGATTQAQINQATSAANSAATNQALSQGATQDQAAAAGNAAAQNALQSQNLSAMNTSLGANAAAQNASTLQQGSMNQQTNLTNQQALLSSTALNANQQNATLGQEMQQSSYDTAQAEAYQAQYQEAQENLAALGSKQAISSIGSSGINPGQIISGTLQSVGSGAAAIASVASDRRAKTNITSGKRDVYSFLTALKGA
jgi:hypothetical protein